VQSLVLHGSSNSSIRVSGTRAFLTRLPICLLPTSHFEDRLVRNSAGTTPSKEYVRLVRDSLSDYRCEILTCVAEGERAFAKMRFSGRHTASFRGFEPTGKPVHWLGAAFFRFEGDSIAEVWVLGDLAGLDALLEESRLTRA